MGEPFESRSAAPASYENRRSWLVQKLVSDDVGAAEPRVLRQINGEEVRDFPIAA